MKYLEHKRCDEQNSIAKTLDEQNCIIRKQSNLIAELSKMLENYISFEEISSIKNNVENNSKY